MTSEVTKSMSDGDQANRKAMNGDQSTGKKSPDRKRRHGSQKSNRKQEVVLPTPPDGGWGWVVVFSSFMIHIIADGIAYSTGIFFIEFQDYFHAGKGETGWIGSILIGVTWGSGESIIFTLGRGRRVGLDRS